MENPADDPREFVALAGEDNVDDFLQDDFQSHLRNFLSLNPAMSPRSPTGQSDRTRSPGGFTRQSGFTIHIDRTADGQRRTTFSSSPRSPRTGGRDPTDIPQLADFISRADAPGGQNRDTITGSLMFQYLLALLSQNGGRDNPFGGMFPGMPLGAENGRMGDYVFNQEALDQIITQIMENSSAHPVPATEEIMQKLPREVLEENAPILEKDCAVCKDQFSLQTEDPAEQVVVTLPCKHPFHEPCIMPWLKSSATCPVCRYELVPQPKHHDPASRNTNPGSSAGNNPSGSSNSSDNTRRGNDATDANGGLGMFNALFSLLGGNPPPNGPNPNSGNDHQNDDSSNSRRQRNNTRNDRDLPGGWAEDVD